MSTVSYRTASVGILDEPHKQICEICPQNAAKPPAWAFYSVFDGNRLVYSCGRHLGYAVLRVATRK